MVRTRGFIVECDECGEELYCDDADTETDAEEEAHEDGWSVHCGETLCPECATEASGPEQSDAEKFCEKQRKMLAHYIPSVLANKGNDLPALQYALRIARQSDMPWTDEIADIVRPLERRIVDILLGKMEQVAA